MELIYTTAKTGKTITIPYTQEGLNMQVDVSCSLTLNTRRYTLNGVYLRWTVKNGPYYKVWAGGSTYSSTGSVGSQVTVQVNRYTESADGNETTIRFTASFMRQQWAQASYYDVNVVADVTEKVVATASTVKVEEAEVCSPQTVKLTNEAEEVTHRVTWSYPGNVSHTEELEAGVRETAWAIPRDSENYATFQAVMQATPNSDTIVGTVTVETYDRDGALVGSAATEQALLTIPNNWWYRPEVIITPTSNEVSAGGETLTYTQNLNQVTVSFYVALAVGATAVRMTLSSPEWKREISSAQDTVTFTPHIAGNYELTFTVEDSRGFIGSTSQILSITANAPPVFRTLSAERCNAQKAADDEGVYALVRASVATSLAGGTATVRAQLKTAAGANIGSAVTLSGGEARLGGSLDAETSYQIQVTATDQAGQIASATLYIGTAIHTIYRMAGGKGLAFGQKANKLGVEVRKDWPFYVHGQEILRLLVDVAHPVGSLLTSRSLNFDPNGAWPWTLWRKLSSSAETGDTWIRVERGTGEAYTGSVAQTALPSSGSGGEISGLAMELEDLIEDAQEIKALLPTANQMAVFARNVGEIEDQLETVQTTYNGIDEALASAGVWAMRKNLLNKDAWWVNNGSANLVCGDAARYSKSGGAYMKSITGYRTYTTEPTAEQTAGATYVYHREAGTDSSGTAYPEAWIVYRDADDGIVTSCVALTGSAIITEQDGEVYDKAIQYNITANTAWGNMETLYYPQGAWALYYKQGEAFKSYGYIVDEMEVGEVYTVSCWARLTSGSEAWLKFGWGGAGQNSLGYPSDIAGASDVIKVTGSEWHRIAWTFTFSPTGAEYTETTETVGEGSGAYTRVKRSYNWNKRVMIGVHRKYTATLQLCGFRLSKGGLYGSDTVDTLKEQIKNLTARVAALESGA